MSEPIVAPPGVWWTLDGRVLAITRMHGDHLRNAANQMRRGGITTTATADEYRSYRAAGIMHWGPEAHEIATEPAWRQLCAKLAELEAEQQRRTTELQSTLFTNLPPELQ